LARTAGFADQETPESMSLTEFAAREERIRIQRIYNPNKDPYRHETIGMDPKKKTFLEQIIEQNNEIDKQCASKQMENSVTNDLAITDEELCSIEFY
jgi:hypothetical protein